MELDLVKNESKLNGLHGNKLNLQIEQGARVTYFMYFSKLCV